MTDAHAGHAKHSVVMSMHTEMSAYDAAREYAALTLIYEHKRNDEIKRLRESYSCRKIADGLGVSHQTVLNWAQASKGK